MNRTERNRCVKEALSEGLKISSVSNIGVWCVYLVKNKHTLLYVGVSDKGIVSFSSTLMSNHKEIVDEMTTLQCFKFNNEEEATRARDELIVKLSPKYNKCLRGGYITVRKVARKNHIDIRRVRKIIKLYNIEVTSYGDIEYISKDDEELIIDVSNGMG